jgi:16S rRNA (cytidine1402-2'-O)-methyltransferase
VFYEAANRALATLQDMIAAFGAERRVVVARELTKRFETYLHGPLNVLFERLRGDPEQLRGEFVLMVAGACENDGRARQAEEERVLSILSEALPLKQAAALAARITGGRRNRLYRVALARQKRSDPP